MSLRTISLSALPLARANAANAARTLSTTAVYRKSVVDQVKDSAGGGKVEGRSGRSEITDSGEEEEGEGGEIGQVRNVGLALGRGRGTWRRRDWAVFVRNVDRVSQFADALCPLPHR
jgi:hypothetical protein